MERLLICIMIVTILVIGYFFFQAVKWFNRLDGALKMVDQKISENEQLNVVRFDQFEHTQNQVLNEQLNLFNTSINEYVKEELKELRTEIRENEEIQQRKTIDVLVQATRSYENQMENKSDILIQEFSNRLETKLNQLNTSIQSGLEAYLVQEDEEIKSWLVEVKGQRDNTAIQLLESALNKFPGNKELIQAYKKHVEPFFRSEDQATRKRAIERYSRAVHQFLDNCHVSDWKEAKQMHTEALTLRNLHIQNQVRVFEKEARDTITELEELAIEYPLSDSQLAQVEFLDQKIPKDLLKKHPELYERYMQVTNLLFKQLAANPDEESLKRYNAKAISEFKSALDLFSSLETFYKQGNNLESLTSLLGSWDFTYLTSATQTYFQTVYNEIFSKLEAAHKPKFTELMLYTDKNKVSI